MRLAKLLNFSIVASFALLITPNASPAYAAPSPLQVVKELLSRPAARLDYVEAAISIDQLIAKDANTSETRAMVARLADAAQQLAGPHPSDAYKLAAVRQAIYVAGAWNHGRAFAYDLQDPLRRNLGSRLLSTYVRTRKGNCVSMPILFLIVADRLGLNVHLAMAPLHLFVRYTDPAGVDHNLEATSGGHEARNDWYRTNLPMTDQAIRSGAYMRTLSKRETIAAMATTVMDFLLGERRYQEAVDVADAIIAANPRDAYTFAKKGSAIAGIIDVEYTRAYAGPSAVPAPLRARLAALAKANAQAFREAEALGWRDSLK
jgi:regulator of sirC expression with transglutaminase-like and TPR domain